MTYREYFFQATRRNPYPFQERLAIEPELPQFLDIPTGLGKSAAVVLAWCWHRIHQPETPRRLVICAPTRVLVEQLFDNTVAWLDRLGLLAGRAEWRDMANRRGLLAYMPRVAEVQAGGWAARAGLRGHPTTVHLLMGGEELTDWTSWPEHDAILIGSQDMLLSRALNRGYASRRAKWPVEFGLLHNDCLWVFDEVQLMGNGAATSAQLSAFREVIWQPAIPCSSLWMSATLGDRVLQTRDRDDLGVGSGMRLTLSDEERNQPHVQQRLNAEKKVVLLKNEPHARSKDNAAILDEHVRGQLSLIIVNTVPTAQRIFNAIRDTLVRKSRQTKRSEAVPGETAELLPVLLLHSRFRSADRRDRMQQIESFRERQNSSDGTVLDDSGLILVSTQVVEAGYDISAVRLWSEVAPWPSTIQRLGRLNREGLQPDARGFFWMPRSDSKGENASDNPNAKRIGPYDRRDVEAARGLISQVIAAQTSGVSYHQALEQVASSEDGRSALEVKPEAVLRPDDFFQLFSTEPDLAGGYTDVSPFVRSIDRDADVFVFWRDFDVKVGPASSDERDEEPPPHRDELCSVPFFVFRKFLEKSRCWEWNFESDEWQARRAADVFPGMTLILACSQGGYSPELGWTGQPTDKPNPVTLDVLARTSRRRMAVEAMNRDPASAVYDWHPLADHLDDVVVETGTIIRAIAGIPIHWANSLEVAAAWHDWGKTVVRWQQAVHRYAKGIVGRIDDVLCDPSAAPLHDTARSIRPRFCCGLEDANGTLWAKFPDARRIIEDLPLSDEIRNDLLKRVRAKFRPNLRHEAASALAAWQAWRHGQSPLTALAVYLIAAHHGKARTVLRALKGSDEVFGLKREDRLQPVAPRFIDGASLNFGPKVIGTRGQWNDNEKSFTPADPSWTAMIAELLGPPPSSAAARVVIRENEPAELGPFALAYLEALLRAADVRASERPGRGVQS